MRLIDAEALREHIKKEMEYAGLEEYEISIFKALDNAPTLEDRPIGHWEVRVNNLNKSRTIHCTICDYHFPSWQDKFNFCPNCGARMEEAENDK